MPLFVLIRAKAAPTTSFVTSVESTKNFHDDIQLLALSCPWLLGRYELVSYQAMASAVRSYLYTYPKIKYVPQVFLTN